MRVGLGGAGKGQGLSVAPYAAGHLIGGAVWRISLDGEDIVYAVDYNHRKERHLNGTALEATFSRPAVLITGSTCIKCNSTLTDCHMVLNDVARAVASAWSRSRAHSNALIMPPLC